jgi:hypothetical protein
MKLYNPSVTAKKAGYHTIIARMNRTSFFYGVVGAVFIYFFLYCYTLLKEVFFEELYH